MTEEIEAHVLKKYEILQKLGMSIPNRILVLFIYQFSRTTLNKTNLSNCREGRLWHSLESDR
jgi:hypothetical protein